MVAGTTRNLTWCISRESGQLSPFGLSAHSGLSAYSARCTAARKLVAALRSADRLARIRGQVGKRALDLAPHSAERDAEHALAALQQVDNLVRRCARIHACTIAHQ